VFLGSIASAGNVGQISYSSTKAGLEGAASTRIAESMYYGVRCSLIHPGFTDTPMVRALGEEYIRTKVLPQRVERWNWVNQNDGIGADVLLENLERESPSAGDSHDYSQ
jgi:NAD(P)-dependent dehydrogenase (short-subunit alcohol dehydrogenase family)